MGINSYFLRVGSKPKIIHYLMAAESEVLQSWTHPRYLLYAAFLLHVLNCWETFSMTYDKAKQFHTSEVALIHEAKAVLQ